MFALAAIKAQILQLRDKGVRQMIKGFPKGNDTSRPRVIHFTWFKICSATAPKPKTADQGLYKADDIDVYAQWPTLFICGLPF